MKFFQSVSIVEFQQPVLIQRLHLVHGNIHAVHAAEDGAALFFTVVSKSLDLLAGSAKEFVKFGAEGSIVWSNGRQHSWVEERSSKRRLKLPHGMDNSRFQESIQVTKSQNLLLQRIKAAKDQQVFFGKCGQIGVGKNLNQCNFER